MGGPGDVTALEMLAGEFKLRDAQENALSTTQKLALRLTVCGGEAPKLDKEYPRTAELWVRRG